MNPFVDQLPPSDTEAEEAVIAALMVDPEVGHKVASTLEAGHFFREKNAWIFEAAMALWARGEDPNQITVAHELAARKRLADVGGQTYLADVIRRLPTSIGIEFYANIVRTTASYRDLIHAATGILQMAYEAPAEADAVFARAEELLQASRGVRKFNNSSTPDDIAVRLWEEAEQFIADPSVIRGIPTGWGELDFLLDGLVPGNFIVVGAATSIGKSLFCHNLCRSLCNAGVPVTLWTTEMSDLAAAERMAWMEAGVDKQTIRRNGGITTGQANLYRNALDRVLSWPIRWARSANPTIASIRAEARRDKALRGCVVQLVDHLGKVRADGRTTIERTAAVTDGLSGIAMDEEVVMLATSQVTRESQKGARFLGLSDLANASNVEQDASQVLLLTPIRWKGNEMEPVFDFEARELMARDGYLPVNLSVSKQRRGSTGNAPSAVDWNRGGRIDGFVQAVRA